MFYPSHTVLHTTLVLSGQIQSFMRPSHTKGEWGHHPSSVPAECTRDLFLSSSHYLLLGDWIRIQTFVLVLLLWILSHASTTMVHVPMGTHQRSPRKWSTEQTDPPQLHEWLHCLIHLHELSNKYPGQIVSSTANWKQLLSIQHHEQPNLLLEPLLGLKWCKYRPSFLAFEQAELLLHPLKNIKKPTKKVKKQGGSWSEGKEKN